MKIRIYQINLKRDVNKRAFMGLSMYNGAPVDGEIYDCVFDGEIEPEYAKHLNELESVFAHFNYTEPRSFRALSVSDVVEVVESEKTAPGFYFCDNFGWVKIPAFRAGFIAAEPKEPKKPMKASLATAIAEAEKQSREHPGETFYVLDKKGQHSRVVSQPWDVFAMGLHGWTLIKRFLNGKEA